MSASTQNEPLQLVEQRELRRELLALIAGLPTLARESMLLCDLGDHSQGELATLQAAHPALAHARSSDGRSLLGHLDVRDGVTPHTASASQGADGNEGGFRKPGG